MERNKLKPALFILLFLSSLIIFPSFVNGEIFLEQPKELYNLGDILEVRFIIKEPVDSAGFLELNLICPSKTMILYREYLSIGGQEEYPIKTLWPISSAGLCYIRVEFNDELVTSEEFTITDRIDVTVELNKEHFIPGENLIISGNALKANLQGADGFAQVSIPGLIEEQYLNINEGNFSLEITIQSYAEARGYELQIYVFEENNKGEKTNNGFAIAQFFVSPVPTTFDLSLNDEDFIPGEKLVIKPSLYDQASGLIEEDVSLEIEDSLGSIIMKRVVKSGDEVEFLLAGNAVPGDWKIKAIASGFEERRFIYIREYEAIVVEIQDNIMKVRNIGNVPYEKPLEIKFINETGEALEVKILSLEIGEEVKYQLTAPSGIYTVETSGMVFENVLLTGLAVGAIELKKKEQGLLMQYPLISLFIFILLLVVLILLSYGLKQNPLKLITRIPRRQGKVKGLGNIPLRASGGATTITSAVGTGQKSLMPVKRAQSSLVLKGTKQRVSVLFIKIKNLAELKHKLPRTSLNALVDFTEKIITQEVEEQKGAIHKVGDSEILAIFSPNLKQFRHELAAIKAGAAIGQALKEYNYKLREKIEYGLGVNSGDLILNIQQVMLYTSIGKTIPIARKIAEHASKEVLASRDISLRATPEVKFQRAYSLKISGEDVSVYGIENIGGREVYKSYVTDILERMKREE